MEKIKLHNNLQLENQSIEKLSVTNSGGMADLNRKLIMFLTCFMYFFLVLQSWFW